MGKIKKKEIMMGSIEKIFEGFLYERQEEASSNIVIGNREYEEVGEKQDRVLKMLLETLNSEQKKLLREFEELEAERDCIQINLLYRQAVKDGFELNSILVCHNRC